MPTTYDLMRESERITEQVCDLLELHDGDPPPEVAEEIAALLGGLGASEEAKLEGLYHVSRRAEHEAELLRSEAARLTARARAAENAGERAKGLASMLLRSRRDRLGEPGAKVRTATITAWLQRTPPAVEGPADVAKWSEQGWYRSSISPDKTLAKEALTAIDPADWPAGFRLTSREIARFSGAKKAKGGGVE